MSRKINRGTLQDVRQQIGDTVMKFPLVKKILESDETLEIPVNYQLIVYNSFTVEGTLQNDGELVILDDGV